MKLNPRRPVYLNLLRIRLPIAGMMSIIHRASGLAMFFAIPALVWLVDRSLSGPEGFAEAQTLLGGVIGKLTLFCALWALLHHLYAGIRYLLIDIDVGVERPAYRYSAWAVTLAGPLSALALMGVLQ